MGGFVDIVPPDSLFGRLRAAEPAAWLAYVTHEFPRRLGDASLPEASFRHYLVQDYLFLIHFARAYGLAVSKSTDLAQMRHFAATGQAILDEEMTLHIDYCAAWGVGVDQLEAAEEAGATLAYTRFVLATGHGGDLLDLQVALAPCMIGYAEIANRLIADPATRRTDNPYAPWIDMYAADGFQQVAKAELAMIDTVAAGRDAPGRFDELRRIFRRACRLEADFWQMGLTGAA